MATRLIWKQQETSKYSEMRTIYNNTKITKLGDDVVPLKYIHDQKYMDEVRRCFTLNINMPGTIENEDPNRFIRGIYTTIIPYDIIY